MNHRYASEREATAAAKRLRPEQQHEWSSESCITTTPKGAHSTSELIISSIPFIIASVLFAILQFRRLYFKEYIVTYTDEQFQEAVSRTVKELEWIIANNNKTFFRAYRPNNWTGSWGEMITIIKVNDCLLINSICDPEKPSSITSYGWNRRNIKAFLSNLSDVLNNKPAVAKSEKVIKEWSIKNTLFRLLTYPLCFFLIALSIYMIVISASFKSMIYGLIIMSIAITYLYTDIKVLITRKQKSNKSQC